MKALKMMNDIASAMEKGPAMKDKHQVVESQEHSEAPMGQDSPEHEASESPEMEKAEQDSDPIAELQEQLADIQSKLESLKSLQGRDSR